MLLSSRLRSLRQNTKAVHLDFLPQELKISEVIVLILIFITRQVLHLLGYGHSLSLKHSHSKEEDKYELPKLSTSMPFRIRKRDLVQYAQAVNLDKSENVLETPAQTCLLLSVLSMPAMLLLLAHGDSPVRPLGAVNARNRFELLRPDLCTEEALLELQGGAEVKAELMREARRVRRGLEIDLSVEVVLHGDGDDGGREVVIFRQVFTMLQFMKFNKTTPAIIPQGVDTGPNDDSLWLQATSVPFKLQADGPKAWAAICKDYNPIHMSTLAAKVLGFPGRIGHGNHALALAVARLEGVDEMKYDERKRMGRGRRALEMDVQFKRPISLPASLTAESVSRDGKGYYLRVMRSGKVCVTASVNMSAGT